MQARSVIPLKRRAFDQWKIANPWLRFCAQLIDQTLIGFVTGSILQFLFPEKAWTSNWWLTWLLFWPFITISAHSLSLALMGTTPGKKAFGLIVSSTHPGKILTHWQILQRTISWWIGIFSLGASWSTILSRSDRRAWHDIVAETVVLSQTKEASHQKTYEKSIGISWGIVSSLILVIALSILFVIQVKRLANQNLTAIPQNIEALSWALLNGNLPEVRDSGLPETEQKLVKLLGHYGAARLIPLAQRFDYYKTHMQKDEDYLCQPGQKASQPCQSARLMSQLLTNEGGKNQTPGALPVLKLIEKLDEFADINEEIKYLAAQSKKALLHSAEYLALKTAQARLLTNRGDFEKATELLAQDILHIPESSLGKVEKVVYSKLLQTACEAQALVLCQTQSTSCTVLPYWKSWNFGCNQKQAPLVDASNTSKLSFWWNKLKEGKELVSSTQWHAFKTQIETSQLSEFEHQLFTAMDFVANIKSEDPQDVKDKAALISKDSPLWVWAHSMAIKEYGRDWFTLMRKADKKYYTYLGLKDSAGERRVASQEKRARKPAAGKHKSKKQK